MERHFEILRILDKAMRHDDNGVKAYARKLAKKYREAGDSEFADLILSYIGDVELPMATMDETGDDDAV